MQKPIIAVSVTKSMQNTKYRASWHWKGAHSYTVICWEDPRDWMAVCPQHPQDTCPVPGLHHPPDMLAITAHLPHFSLLTELAEMGLRSHLAFSAAPRGL